MRHFGWTLMLTACAACGGGDGSSGPSHDELVQRYVGTWAYTGGTATVTWDSDKTTGSMAGIGVAFSQGGPFDLVRADDLGCNANVSVSTSDATASLMSGCKLMGTMPDGRQDSTG